MKSQQERHTEKIAILAKCIEAGVINLQEALLLLDADIVEVEKKTSSPSLKDTGTHTVKPWPQINTPSTQDPLTKLYPNTGTIRFGSGISTLSITGGTSTTYTVPQAHTLTNIIGYSQVVDDIK